MPAPDPETGLIECNWHVSHILSTRTDDPHEWLSGVYLAKLTGTTSGKQSYIIFVVREDERSSRFPLSIQRHHFPGLQQLGRQIDLPFQQPQ